MLLPNTGHGIRLKDAGLCNKRRGTFSIEMLNFGVEGAVLLKGRCATFFLVWVLT